MIRVRVAEPDGNQVVLWERHPAHPGGEVFLAGNGEFDVAETPAVEARLRNGRLVLVEPAFALASPEKGHKAQPEPTEAEPEAAKPKKPAPARGRGGL